MINGHGNNLYHYDKDKIKGDFSSNIAFNNHSDKILSFLKDRIEVVKNYPDPEATKLTKKIALHHNIQSENILVTNGSAEAFYVVAHYISRKANNRSRTLIFTPAFAEYEDSCALFEHQLSFTSTDNFHSEDFSAYDSVWIGSPNNPNGYRVTNEEVVKKCEQFRDTVFVVDKAYNELSSSSESSVEIPENMITINSLTKTFGIPGIRLGYVIASESCIEEIAKMRAPWSVNSLSLLAGEYVMDNYSMLFPDIEELLKESRCLQNEINKIKGLKVSKSDCNFFLCQIEGADTTVQELKEFLIENFGLLIRNASNFRDLTDKHFRLATQAPNVNMKLIEALKAWSRTLF